MFLLLLSASKDARQFTSFKLCLLKTNMVSTHMLYKVVMIYASPYMQLHIIWYTYIYKDNAYPIFNIWIITKNLEPVT